MSDVKTDILNAAEKRMQRGGFGGFSFREIGSDVGVKSSSVHYHFPTKDDLAAAVIRRWSERTSKNIDRDLEKDTDPVRVLTNAFRRTAQSKDRMCPCTVLAAASQDLPERVAAEVRDFFTMCQDKLASGGLIPVKQLRCCRPLLAPWSSQMRWGTRQSMIVPLKLCCVSVIR